MAMNVLDENIPDREWHQLRRWRLRLRKVGEDIGRAGMSDQQIIPLLHQLRGVTFLTRDVDYYRQQLCHSSYCLVYLDVRADKTAFFVRAFLRHPAFDSRAKRMGRVIGVRPMGMHVWRLHAGAPELVLW